MGFFIDNNAVIPEWSKGGGLQIRRESFVGSNPSHGSKLKKNEDGKK